MSNSKFTLGRRDLLKTALLGSVGFGAMSALQRYGVGGVSAYLRDAIARTPGLGSMDAAELLADALRFGPSLLFISEAMAQTTSRTAVFRVFYKTSHDSRNELHLIDHGNQYNPLSTLNYGSAATAVQGKTRKAPEPHSIMNEWAYKIMSTGKIDGTIAFPGAPDKPALTVDELQKISIIAAVGMGGSEGIHQRGAVPRVGSLEYSMVTGYPGYSPIGSVSMNTSVIDSSGGVNDPGRSISSFLGAIDVPAVYMSRDQKDNPVRTLDDLTGNAGVKAVRNQMLDAHAMLVEQLKNIKQYGALSGQTFNTFGQRKMEGLASMMLFADLFQSNLATIGSTGMNSFDFHATDAMRAPSGDNGNMLTETAQALAGVFHIARAAFASKQDAVVHFTTCSNRNETWVNDDSHVSTITFIIKGAASSPFDDVPSQLALLPDNVDSVYADGPGSGSPGFTGEDAEKIGLTGNLTVGRLESTIVRAVGKASGLTPATPLEDPSGKLI